MQFFFSSVFIFFSYFIEYIWTLIGLDKLRFKYNLNLILKKIISHILIYHSISYQLIYMSYLNLIQFKNLNNNFIFILNK